MTKLPLGMSKYTRKCDGIHLPFAEKWLRMASRKETVKKLRKRSEGAEVEKENWRNKTKIKWSHWRTCIIGKGSRAESGAWFLSWTVSGTDRKIEVSRCQATKASGNRWGNSRTWKTEHIGWVIALCVLFFFAYSGNLQKRSFSVVENFLGKIMEIPLLFPCRYRKMISSG